jgi:hypothetical protein
VTLPEAEKGWQQNQEFIEQGKDLLSPNPEGEYNLIKKMNDRHHKSIAVSINQHHSRSF